MAWNEPGGNNRDPWGGGGNDQGPPDLDEVVRKMQDKLGGLFGKRGGGGRSGGFGGGSALGLGFIIVLALGLWLFSGFYIVDPAERGVILRLGKYQETVGEGLHWHIPYPVEQVEKVNVDQVRQARHRAQMLTQDENLIAIAMSVQYQVKDAQDYLFRVRNPDYTLKEATESALREVVGSKTLDDIFSKSGGREVVVNETEKNIQELLDIYRTGLRVVKVNLESAQPPEEVQSAFDDAIKAREDEDRFKKQAEAYERDIIPKAEGDAQRLVQEAEAYKQQVVELAKGETSRFLQTLTEYQKAPEITRKRLYLETMETVLNNVSKVLIKTDQGNNIMYLPLDQFMRRNGNALAAPSVQGYSGNTAPAPRSRPRTQPRPLREGR
ncbi:FtsH protease activity modulator HflK [Thiohalobacter sp. IOR34]|uniref:FtsH protease activity modulator HflK n=1 Tax=Thiohalobacter sp. IOR34 TaxID=3057176 RepID=UPI0025B28002|nr:FtsH protease activity modulator HflK [Thiohalobacter sp. IOR34]WJW74820.1 FtsH protease activity modulator HflK [Thiohalobacter sp. IOR34]